jgi:hypothetical protein
MAGVRSEAAIADVFARGGQTVVEAELAVSAVCPGFSDTHALAHVPVSSIATDTSISACRESLVARARKVCLGAFLRVFDLLDSIVRK